MKTSRRQEYNMETMVMKQGEAIAWLKKEASNLIDDYTDSSYTADDVA